MKKILILFFVIVIVGLLWLLMSRFGGHSPASDSYIKDADESPNLASGPKSPSVLSGTNRSLAGIYPRWKGGRSRDLTDPRWKTLRERENIDRAWQGKMPIEFFGKIIDFAGLPIEGATVEFSWTDLSPTGSSQLSGKSDANGLFSLTNAIGKNLGVKIAKDGYYTTKQDRYGFEYAEFSDENFHQPDPKNPVLFRLRKKQDSDPLFYREQELKVSIGGTSEVALDAGAKLKIELLTNPRPGQGQWSMRLSSPAGGLQTAAEEFPFFAPEDNYQSTLVLDSFTPKPPRWTEIYEGGIFYMKTGSVYGRIEIQMITGKDWMRIKSWLNPSGSRNLEFDPANVIKSEK